MEIVLLSLWLPCYIISLAFFFRCQRSFAAAFRKYSSYFNSRAVFESPSVQEDLAFELAKRWERRGKQAFAVVAVFFLMGAILINFLASKGLVGIFSAVALGALFLIAIFASLRVLSQAEEFDDAICHDRYNPARASEFM